MSGFFAKKTTQMSKGVVTTLALYYNMGTAGVMHTEHF